MKGKLALVLAAAALVSPVGCTWHEGAWGVGGGSAANWSAPAPIAEQDTYAGVDVSFTPLPTFGLYHYFDGDESFTAPYVTWDFGVVMVPLTRGTYWPVVKPVLGWYRWSESPEERGWLTGVKLGAVVGLSRKDRPGFPRWFVSYEHGWFIAHDAVGEDDARFQTTRLALFCILGL